MKDTFRRAASKVSNVAGSATTFLFALAIVIVWALTGPLFDYSSTWQLMINTGTTIVTFLMIFLVQNTQNRDGKAMQLKLDELIRATRARDSFIDIEDLTDAELSVISDQFSKANDPTIKKLHAKIEAAHTRRKHSIPSTASHMANKLNPFYSNSDQKNKKSS